MRQWIAFLRAINVGGHNVKMEQLRAVFEALGFANVTTFIASGNVIFETTDEESFALERRIERQLHQTLGYGVATFLRSPTELAAIAAYQPFSEFDFTETGSALFIAFLPTTPSDAAAQKLLALRTTIDDFCIHNRELYWLCRTKASESTFSGARLEKTLGMSATVRNSTTVRKLAAKYPAST